MRVIDCSKIVCWQFTVLTYLIHYGFFKAALQVFILRLRRIARHLSRVNYFILGMFIASDLKILALIWTRTEVKIYRQ